MKLKRRRPAPARPDWYDDWPLLPPADLVGSDAARRFDDALRRFVAGEIPGRSFLIAGHRGAGKTTLVRNAAEQLTREIFGRLVNDATAGIPADSLAAIPQRPLLVRVNGPSLILEELPGPGAGEGTPAPAEPASAAPKAETQKARNPPHGPAAPSTKKQSILVQLTTALYRALARECAAAFAIHARAMDIADAAEVAGQLQLALDEAPDPALLRAYWQKFDALEQGVFFPRAIGRAFVDARFTGQGLREIVAIATAAQIFEVAAGKVAFSRIKKDSSKVAQEAGKASADAWSEALRKLFGFAVGAGLGGGAAAGLNFSGTASLLAGLAGGLASGWTSSLSRTREDTLDYKVTLDRSEASLERDLPLALDRIRAAGFAPVFLIDELDKLDEGTDGTGHSEGKAGKRDIETTMSELILRMKQLTTDYGFFCFLVDRSYFDRVQGKIERETYPIEYSFFSERLYVSPAPLDLQTYILKLYTADGADAGGDAAEDEAARIIFAKQMLHQSKLNMLDLIREIDVVDAIETSAVLGSQRFRLTALVQMAVELVLGEPELSARANQDISFRQSLIDALYIVSRAWERDEKEVRLGDADVAAALIDRMYALPPEGDEAEPEGAQEKLIARIGKRDVDLLTGAAQKLALLLCNVASLQRKLEASGIYSIELLRVISRIDPPLLCRENATEDGTARLEQAYLFQYSSVGSRAADRDGVALDQSEVELARKIADFRKRSAGQSKLGNNINETAGEMPLNDLFLADLVSAEFSAIDLRAALGRLAEVAETGQGYAGYASDKEAISNALLFKKFLPTTLMQVALWSNVATDSKVSIATVAHRLRGVLDISALQDRLGDGLISLEAIVRHPPPFDPGILRAATSLAEEFNLYNWMDGVSIKSFEQWAESTDRFLSKRERRLPNAEGVWRSCAGTLLRLFDLPNASPAPDKPEYDDLLVLAMNILPAPLLRRGLSEPSDVTATDWSCFALEAITTGSGRPSPTQPSMPVPGWMAVPALFALGFGQSLLAALAEPARALLHDPPDAAALRLLDELPARAHPNTPPGIAVRIADDSAPTWAKTRQPGDPPVFPVRASQIPRYDSALTMLTQMKALQGIFDELRE